MDMDTLARRVARLEGSNRLWRGGFLLLATGFVALVSMGQQGGGKVLEVEKLVLKDAQGNLRAELKLKEKDGLPALVFYDQKIQHRAVLTLGNKGAPVLSFLDAQGHNRAILMLTEEGAGTFALADGAENVRASLAMASDEQTGLTLSNAEGRPRATFLTDKTGSPSFALFANGEARLAATLGEKSEPVISLSDQHKPTRTRAAFGLTANGAPLLYLADEKGARLTIAAASEATGIDLSDKDGKTRLEVQLGKDGAPKLNLVDREGKSVFSKP